MSNSTVAVIGGGLSGLYAAQLLSQAGIDFVLIEARERIGGRILSSSVEPDRHPEGGRYDLGPTWFWPMHQKMIARLVRDLDLQTFEQPYSGVSLYEGSDNQLKRMGSPVSGQVSMRINGGMQRIVEELAARIPPEKFRLNCRVVRANLDDQGVDLEVMGASGTIEHYSARYVISTLPLRLLAKSIAFEPQLPRSVLENWSAIPTWMAASAKFVAVYESAFWRKAGWSGYAYSLPGPLEEIHDASPLDGLPALFGFVSSYSRQRAGNNLHTLALQELERLFGPAAARPVDTFYKNWSAEEYTATSADAVSPHFHLPYGNHRVVPSPWASNFLLAGSEASRLQGGYMEGALLIAHEVVTQVLKDVARSKMSTAG